MDGMDYPYFTTAAPQAYPFVGLPPTPSHTNSISEHDFCSNPSPPVRSQFPTSSFKPDPLFILTPVQDANFDFQFEGFNQHFTQNTQNALHKPPQTPHSQPNGHKPSFSSSRNGHGLDQDLGINTNTNTNINPVNLAGSNSDDDENMTPAVSRRKAQNRAAQRAFRERRERHVKDLEAQNANLEKNSASVAQENERLKLQLQKATTENEILKITSANPRERSEPLPTHGPMRFSPTDFYTEVLHAHENKTPSHRIVTSESGQKLYAAGATWDYIINNQLFKRGLVDIGDVSDRLKRVAKCDGQGPVFEEREILSAIEKSVASGNDELL
ncbi:Fluconazole resistance protein 3 [Lachnellula arida]|uniref:Fluconazole resistance protein 3 n=1 Tax=Lachnellula arida TaxID=1316785 RepID=A0A8T9BC53_9HELO|nr:Fluconazole resistance protein 3 [Lachnellula arida]